MKGFLMNDIRCFVQKESENIELINLNVSHRKHSCTLLEGKFPSTRRSTSTCVAEIWTG